MSQERLKILYPTNELTKIRTAHVLIVGLGGVGSICFEALLRFGIGRFTIVDYDLVEASNLNRQLQYTTMDIGLFKVEVAKRRALAINPEVVVQTYNKRLDTDFLQTIDLRQFDFVIDAFDDLMNKAKFLQTLLDSHAPFISSLGMGNRFNSSEIQISNLKKTFNDPMAKKLRYILKNEGVDLSKIPVVFSSENVGHTAGPIGSSFVCPNVAGIKMAEYAIATLIRAEK